MKLLISYHLIGWNWYVGRLYYELHNELIKNKELDIEFIDISDLSEKYGFDKSGYSNNRPSIFSPYNLIIQNKENNKTFVHSFHDFAPIILEEGTGHDFFDIVKFSCSSNLTDYQYNRFKDRFNIEPSFYILENWDEHEFIEKNKNNIKINNELYFNGSCYGERSIIKNVLTNSHIFNFKDKHIDNLNKENYYSELSKYKNGLSLNGAAKICYRDLEYFGMGILNFREKLDIKMHEPIVEDVHYFNIFDNDIKSKLHITTEHKYIIEKLEYNIKNILENKDINNILQNTRNWFERNCLPENQIKILLSFIKNLNIIE